jgi:hypothetical protein
MDSEMCAVCGKYEGVLGKRSFWIPRHRQGDNTEMGVRMWIRIVLKDVHS